MLKGNVINLVVDEHFAVPRFCEKMKKLQVIVAEVRKKAFQFKKFSTLLRSDLVEKF